MTTVRQPARRHSRQAQRWAGIQPRTPGAQSLPANHGPGMSEARRSGSAGLVAVSGTALDLGADEAGAPEDHRW